MLVLDPTCVTCKWVLIKPVCQVMKHSPWRFLWIPIVELCQESIHHTQNTSSTQPCSVFPKPDLNSRASTPFFFSLSYLQNKIPTPLSFCHTVLTNATPNSPRPVSVLPGTPSSSSDRAFYNRDGAAFKSAKDSDFYFCKYSTEWEKIHDCHIILFKYSICKVGELRIT